MKIRRHPGQLWQVQSDACSPLCDRLYLILRGYDDKTWMIWLFNDRYPECYWSEKEMKEDKLVCDVPECKDFQTVV